MYRESRKREAAREKEWGEMRAAQERERDRERRLEAAKDDPTLRTFLEFCNTMAGIAREGEQNAVI